MFGSSWREHDHHRVRICARAAPTNPLGAKATVHGSPGEVDDHDAPMTRVGIHRSPPRSSSGRTSARRARTDASATTSSVGGKRPGDVQPAREERVVTAEVAASVPSRTGQASCDAAVMREDELRAPRAATATSRPFVARRGRTILPVGPIERRRYVKPARLAVDDEVSDRWFVAASCRDGQPTAALRARARRGRDSATKRAHLVAAQTAPRSSRRRPGPRFGLDSPQSGRRQVGRAGGSAIERCGATAASRSPDVTNHTSEAEVREVEVVDGVPHGQLSKSIG